MLGGLCRCALVFGLLLSRATEARAQRDVPERVIRTLRARGVPADAMDDARAVLLAEHVGGFHYGVTGAPLREVVGIRNLLRSLPEDARVPVLRALVRHATPAGRVYALAALEGLARPVFERLATRYRRSTVPVAIANEGCNQMGQRTTLGALVGRTPASGAWAPFDVTSGQLWDRLLECDDEASVLCRSGAFDPRPAQADDTRSPRAAEPTPSRQLGDDVVAIVTAPTHVERALLRGPTRQRTGRQIAGHPIQGRARRVARGQAGDVAEVLVAARSYSPVSARACAAENATWEGYRFSRGPDVVEVAVGLSCHDVSWVARVGGESQRWEGTLDVDALRTLLRHARASTRASR